MDLDLECPVCFENLFAPIYQCNNGHLLCRDCIPMIKNCPICREDMPARAVRNRRMEKMAIARVFACPNEFHGCHDINKHHPSDCEFATQKFCSYLEIHGCDDETAKTNLLPHLKAVHNVSGRVTVDGETIEIFQSAITEAVDLEQGKWNPHYINQADKLFLLSTKLLQGKILWTVFVLGSEVTATKFTARIRLLSQHEAEIIRLAVWNAFAHVNGSCLSWKGGVVSLGQNWDKDPLLNIFSVDIQELRKFWKEIRPDEQTWKLHVTVKRKRKNHNPPPRVLQKLISETVRDHQNPPELPLPIVQNIPPRARQNRRRLIAKGIQQNEIHDVGIICDCCKTVPIVGLRYKCIECKDFNLCSACVEGHDHSEHLFLMAFTRDQKIDLQRIYSKYNSSNRVNALKARDEDLERLCDGCGEDPLLGPCHSCTVCQEFDLCQNCINDNLHNHHVFLVAYSVAALRKLHTVLALTFD